MCEPHADWTIERVRSVIETARIGDQDRGETIRELVQACRFLEDELTKSEVRLATALRKLSEAKRGDDAL